MSGLNSVLGVIPARYQSSRFPGKPLATLQGKPMIQWVFQRAKSVLPHVVVATDDKRIFRAVEHFGGNVMMTPKSCKSGSDRVYVVSQKKRFPFLINIQGDEPLIKTSMIRKTIELGLQTKKVATAATKLDQQELMDSHVVKVIVGVDGRALYFTRLPVPTALKHLGIYFYPRTTLMKFVHWKQPRIEREEKLEQLRFMHHGEPIFVTPVSQGAIGVDTPLDLKRVQKILRR